MNIEPKKFKRGETRDDGMVFWQYDKSCTNHERWITPQKFSERQARHVANMRNERRTKPFAYRAIDKKSKDKNRDKVRERLARWSASERGRSWVKNYCKVNVISRSAASRLWEKNNAQKLKDRSAKYRKENAARIKQKSKEWCAMNRDKTRAMCQLRHARKMKQVPDDFSRKMVAEIYAWARRLEKKLGITYAVDHIMPLSKGGEHSHRNLQPLPASINLRKNNNMLKVPDCYRTDGVRFEPSVK
jgi:hypothetical protein